MKIINWPRFWCGFTFISAWTIACFTAVTVLAVLSKGYTDLWSTGMVIIAVEMGLMGLLALVVWLLKDR